MNNSVNAILLRIKAFKRISWEELADEIGTSRTAVTKWRRGLLVPSKEHLEKIEDIESKLNVKASSNLRTLPMRDADHHAWILNLEDITVGLYDDSKEKITKYAIELAANRIAVHRAKKSKN